jgi:16S rRNA (cytidine1402-2'-O)-methyltransferase
LQELQSEPRTMIIYESPYRIVKSLAQFAEVFGADRRMAAVREISKKFEECVRGTIAEVLAHFTEHEPKGEFVLIVEGAPQIKNKDKKKKDNHKERDEE